MKITIEKIRFRFKFRDTPDHIDFPATATVVIGQFEVRGFSIRKSKYPTPEKRHALFPPANRMGKGGWVKLFWASKEDWNELEETALREFDVAHEEYLLEQEKKKEENTLDDIKF